MREFTAKMPQTQSLRVQTSCEPAQSKCTWTCNKSNFIRDFAGKRSRPKNRTILCEPVQSKCAWTCHKTNYRKNAAPQEPRVAPACALEIHMDISQEPFYARGEVATQTLCQPAQSKFTLKNDGARERTLI